MNWVREEQETRSLIAPTDAAASAASGGAVKARTTPEATGATQGGMLQRSVATSVTLYLARQVQYIGRPGVAGIALLVFALAFFVGANSPLRSHLAELQSSLGENSHRSSSEVARTASPTAQMQALVSRLPARAELPAITEKIVAQATAAGLSLERGTYDFTVTRSGRLVRARLSFPVQGRYPAIRKFVDGTLEAVPGAAIDGLKLGRKNIGAAEIEADVQFAVYLRSTP